VHYVCSEFCLADLDEDHFNKMVYKLNHNVLHMCFTQAVPVEELHPLQTIHNVLMLLKSVELGRWVLECKPIPQ
jgi:beclin 1-associated autophagy-related key regulator